MQEEEEEERKREKKEKENEKEKEKKSAKWRARSLERGPAISGKKAAVYPAVQAS